MLFIILTLITALMVAGVAAWFSIVGLMAIFPTAILSILIMGATLEVAKLVTASWLYRNWKSTGILLKTYLTTAVIVLMCITSIGVFGYLSKAHLDQTAPAGDTVAKVERIDQQIQKLQKEVDSADRIVLQLDNAVTTLTEYSKISGAGGALAIRKEQQAERTQLQAIISESLTQIDQLEDKKFELMIDVRKLESEVGPIRYVAELFYGNEKADLESAVRFVIILLVMVLDPLAVLLLIAANQSLMTHKRANDALPVENTLEPITLPEKEPVLDESSINKYTTEDTAPSPPDDATTIDTTRRGWLSRGGR
jgi:hypothetical protein